MERLHESELPRNSSAARSRIFATVADAMRSIAPASSGVYAHALGPDSLLLDHGERREGRRGRLQIQFDPGRRELQFGDHLLPQLRDEPSLRRRLQRGENAGLRVPDAEQNPRSSAASSAPW